MPSRKTTKAAMLPIPKDTIDQFVTGPMRAESVESISLAFKTALIERALGAGLSHHLRYLHFDTSDGDDGVCTLEAVASVRPAARAAVMAEVQQVLDWTTAQFPGEQGPVEDGCAWNHALLVQHEPGGWCTVALTLAAVPHVAAAVLAHFQAEA